MNSDKRHAQNAADTAALAGVGAVIAPSADVTMFGNASTGVMSTQIIAYHVDSGAAANIHLDYLADDNQQTTLPITLTMLR